MADETTPLDQALAVVGGLKAGSWESVEALAQLAVAARDRPGDAAALGRRATEVAGGLKAVSWQSVRALAWLSMADDGGVPG